MAGPGDKYLEAEPAPTARPGDRYMDEPSAPKTGAGDAARMGVAQGLSFGAAPQAVGLANAIHSTGPGRWFLENVVGVPKGLPVEGGEGQSFGDAYRAGREGTKKMIGKAKDDQPLAYYGANVPTAIASSVALGGGPIAGGIAGGALTGLNESDADLTRGEFGQALKDAGTGALIGGGLGVGGVLAGKAAGTALSVVKDRGKLGAWLGGMLGSTVGAPGTGAKLGERLFRRAPKSVPTPAEPAGAAASAWGKNAGKGLDDVKLSPVESRPPVPPQEARVIPMPKPAPKMSPEEYEESLVEWGVKPRQPKPEFDRAAALEEGGAGTVAGKRPGRVTAEPATKGDLPAPAAPKAKPGKMTDAEKAAAIREHNERVTAPFRGTAVTTPPTSQKAAELVKRGRTYTAREDKALKMLEDSGGSVSTREAMKSAETADAFKKLTYRGLAHFDKKSRSYKLGSAPK